MAMKSLILGLVMRSRRRLSILLQRPLSTLSQLNLLTNVRNPNLRLNASSPLVLLRSKWRRRPSREMWKQPWTKVYPSLISTHNATSPNLRDS
jgi:hypothetical protein